MKRLILLFTLCCVVLSCCIQILSAADAHRDLPILPPLKEITHEYTFTFTGGAPFCSQCGTAGAYACSNHPAWIPSRFYVDGDVPKGMIALEVEAILTGSYACTSPATSTVVEVLLNNITIDVLNLNGEKECECNTCDGNVSFKRSTPFGWPNYFYTGAGMNNATIIVHTGSICLNQMVVRVTYGRPTFPLKTIAFRADWPKFKFIAEGICGRSYADSSMGTLPFSDPLPAGNILYSVDVVIFGTWFTPLSGSTCVNATAAITLNGFTVGSSSYQTLDFPRHYDSPNVVTSPCHTYGCDGQWVFSANKLYQDGIPGYLYGGRNNLNFRASSTPNLAFAIVYLYYYNR